MKVKVGDTVYDGNDQPVMVIVSQKEREQIYNMAPGYKRYCQYPEGMDPEEIKKWMKEGT